MNQLELFAPAAPAPMVTCPRCGCCEFFAGECAGKCETDPRFHLGGGWIDLDATLARIEYEEAAA